ncbi:ABC transporter permease [Rhodococcoides yunnanense]|uniref:ABC transporter permease n=1 Tax=Rhodococcoides yunnanense TaxID=278209 RepID=UPI002481BB95|nr:ABC transporter permease [Rhodococcus yunnanensis]
MRHEGARQLYRIGAVAVAVVGWQFACEIGLVPGSAIASPIGLSESVFEIVRTTQFWSNSVSTLRSWILGFAIAAGLAIPTGLVIGSSHVGYRMTRVMIDILRSLPPVAIIPLVLLLYGATEKMAVVIIVLGSVWPILLQSIDGARQVDPTVREMALSYRVPRPLKNFVVVLPSAAPFIATGLRIAGTMSLLLAIGAELIGGAPGLGSAIVQFQLVGDVDGVFAIVVVTAVLGIVLNQFMLNLERKVLRWHPSHRIVVSA